MLYDAEFCLLKPHICSLPHIYTLRGRFTVTLIDGARLVYLLFSSKDYNYLDLPSIGCSSCNLLFSQELVRTTVSKYLSLTNQRILAFLGSITKSDLEILFAALYDAIPQCKLLIQSCQLTYKTFDLFANCFSFRLARFLTLL